MFFDILKHLFHRHPHAPNDESKDPGFTKYMALIHNRRLEKIWTDIGPEADFYRRRCREDELVRHDFPNYGFPIEDPIPVETAHATPTKSRIQAKEHDTKGDICPVTNLKEYFALARK